MRFILITFLSLFFTNIVSATDKYGRGELQLNKQMADYFIKYIRGERGKNPSDFYTTLDGTNGTFWYCNAGRNCTSGALKEDLANCEAKTGKQCAKFALRRYVKWKNGINPGKGKASKFNSKMTDSEMYDKLTELGFYNNK